MKYALCLLAFISLSIPELSARQAPAQLNRFIGSWQGKGNLLGEKAEFEMKWEWVLDHQFLKLEMRSTRSNDDGNPTSFTGHGYYHFTGNTFTGTWLDSRGISFPLKGTVDDHSLISEWGSEDLEQGRTEYTLHRNGSLQVDDYVLRNEAFTLFSHSIYYPSFPDRLKGFTLAASKMSEMVLFYTNVFGIRFEETEVNNFILYSGEWMGLSMLICPAELAQNMANQTRHQLDIKVSDFDSTIERIREHGGSLIGNISAESGIRSVAFYDPDGNSMTLIESKAQK